MNYWYRENEDGTVRLAKLEEMTDDFFRDESRIVAKADMGDAHVSTVFLGLDHSHTGEGPPVLYETMIFGGPHNEFQRRYCTRAQAKSAHESIVKALQEGNDPGEAE